MHLVAVHTDIRERELSDKTKTRHLTKKYCIDMSIPLFEFEHNTSILKLSLT